MIGVGAGLATDKALSLNVVEDNYKIDQVTKIDEYSEETIKDGYQFDFNCYDVERVIDNSIKGVKVEIQMPSDINMAKGEYTWDDYGDNKGTYYNFGYAKGFTQQLSKIKNDIKNGYIRENYNGPYHSVKVRVIMSQETSEKVQILVW